MTMTEIEARGKIKYRIANEMRKAGENKEEYEDLEIALQALKEIREYRELGTVEDIQLIFSLCKDLERIVKKYEAIGTMEELKALKEKDVAKKPILSKSMMTKREFQICPICERLVLYDGIKFNHCQYCGQKLDWKGGATDERTGSD